MTEANRFVSEIETAIAEVNPGYRRLVERDRKIAAVVEALRALLKERLRASDKSQLDLARELGVDPSAVSRGLSGKGDIGLKTLLRYAGALDANPAELLGLAQARAGGGWAKPADAATVTPAEIICEAMTGQSALLNDPLAGALLRQTMMAEIPVEKRQHMMHTFADLLGLESGPPAKFIIR